MIDFSPPEEIQMTVTWVRRFIEEEVKPLEMEVGDLLENELKALQEDGRMVPQLIEVRNKIFRKSGEAGFLALHMPREVGGGGVNHTGMLFVREEVYRHGLGLNHYVLPVAARGPNPMLLYLDERLRDRYLHPLIKGQKTTCLGLTEPEAGSDLLSMKTTARKEGHRWVLNGVKRFVGNGPYADFLQVFAYTQPQRRYDGITGFLVEGDAAGLSRKMVRTIVESGMWAEVYLDEVEVPEENTIGEEGQGFHIMMGFLTGERIDMGAQCVGLAQFLLERSIDYAKQRVTFGKPIGERQFVQGMLADSATEIYAARNVLLASAWKLDRGERVRKESSMAKICATETLQRVADRAIQVFGGIGVAKELPVERIYRLARAMRIYEGTTEIHKRAIAKELGL